MTLESAFASLTQSLGLLNKDLGKHQAELDAHLAQIQQLQAAAQNIALPPDFEEAVNQIAASAQRLDESIPDQVLAPVADQPAVNPGRPAPVTGLPAASPVNPTDPTNPTELPPTETQGELLPPANNGEETVPTPAPGDTAEPAVPTP